MSKYIEFKLKEEYRISSFSTQNSEMESLQILTFTHQTSCRRSLKPSHESLKVQLNRIESQQLTIKSRSFGLVLVPNESITQRNLC